MKRITAILVLLTLVFVMMPAGVVAADLVYTDVPDGYWAQSFIEETTSLGIMQGVGDNRFGLGRNIKRGEFAAMLCRLFKWQKVTPEVPAFTDNSDRAKWYYSDIETVLENGAIVRGDGYFRPEDDITRGEMAVMLVRALGYDTLAGDVEDYGIPFTDVTEDRGYITIASDFGIITGRTPTLFDPKGFAKREEAATMMMRLYARHTSDTSWSNAFYAISSYAQRDLIPSFDSVAFGWSRMEYDAASGVTLNTTQSNGNEFRIPDGFETPVGIAEGSGVATSLNVYMSAQTPVTMPDGMKSNPCSEILLNAERRKQAQSLIVSELTHVFPETGGSIYDGVTIDFEGMKGDELKNAFSLFLQELRPQLLSCGKTLTVTVPPRIKSGGGASYDAYDYRAIGDLADRVILMAHDYAANTMPADLMSAGFTATPVTPFPEVYYALKTATDPVSGIRDKSKLALALSIDSAGWSIQNDVVVNQNAMHPTPDDICKRLSDPATAMNYSDRYRNPYITYYDDGDDTQNTVWYEDSRSISDKISLARMFGVGSISVWRLGLIPDYDNPDGGRDLHYDVLDDILK